jgi:hypothetical protein
MRTLRRDDERGAIGVLPGSGVLMGPGALVIDVGQRYHIRAGRQNGTDLVPSTGSLGDTCPGAAIIRLSG